VRIHRITLQDYRGVAERTVRFAPSGLTLVVGPNEVGKTSMIEALDLLVDEKATARKQAVRDAQPVHRDAGPCVEAELSVGGYRVVYRKRWLKAPECELLVLDPVPAQFTGDRAHERFLEILSECGVDRFLWRQLRVDQAGLVVQADVRSSTVLAGVLGSADTTGTGPEARVHESAYREFRRYYTEKQHIATGELRAAIDELEWARAAHEAAQRTLADAEAAIAEYERSGGLVAENAAELTCARADLAALEEQERLVDREREWLRSLDARLDSARRLSETAAKVAELQQAVVVLAAQAEAAAAEAQTARRTRDDAARRAEALRAQSVMARQAARHAAEQLRLQIDMHEERGLSERLAKIGTARERLAAAAGQLAQTAVDEDSLERIELAYQAWQVARASLEAGAPTVTVTRLGDADVFVDGAPLGPGRFGEDDHPGVAARTVPVSESFTVESPGVVRIMVSPGAAEHARRDRMVQARAAYDEACAEAGVTDVGEARTAHRERRGLLARHEAAERALESALDGDDPGALADGLARLRDRIARLNPDRGTAGTGSDDAEGTDARAGGSETDTRPDACAGASTDTDTGASASADSDATDIDATDISACSTSAAPGSPLALDWWREAESAAGLAAEDADALARGASARLAECTEALATVQVEAAKLDAHLEAARGEAERAQAELAALPPPVDGEDLTDLRAAYETAASRVADLAPDVLELKLKNARSLVPRHEQAKMELRERRAAATERLALYGEGERGPREAADRAEATLARVRARHDLVQRRARAAKLLFETLDAHRLDARRRYAAPLRDRIEAYAAVVFGSNVRIGVGDDLTIATKTEGGVTVPFDQLSAGAREQLSLLGRISCADLISTPPLPDASASSAPAPAAPSGGPGARGEAAPVGGAGVPLIIDDALGHSDRARLDALAAILGAAAERLQIIVLTSAPERFRIAAARVDL
jgi:hypothetical protein